MKTLAITLTVTVTSMITFICTYFYNMTLSHYEQYLALISVIFVDGFFGIIAGIKREGFQTRKALKVLQTAVVWVILLTMLLTVEHAFKGMGWLSETILIPFLVFQIMSALKNASMAGFIKAQFLNYILDQFDQHKGLRQIATRKPRKTTKP
jgi:hypothetical protein